MENGAIYVFAVVAAVILVVFGTAYLMQSKENQ